MNFIDSLNELYGMQCCTWEKCTYDEWISVENKHFRASVSRNYFRLVSKVKKYDHSKNAGHVLRSGEYGALFRHKDLDYQAKHPICSYWHPHLSHECPLDSEACIIEVMEVCPDSGESSISVLDVNFWDNIYRVSNGIFRIEAFRCAGLKEGYSW